MASTITAPQLTAGYITGLGTTNDSLYMQDMTVAINLAFRWRLVISLDHVDVCSLDVWNNNTLSWSNVWTLAPSEIGAIEPSNSTNTTQQVATWQPLLNALAQRATTIVNAPTGT